MAEQWRRAAQEGDLKEGVPFSAQLDDESKVLLVRMGGEIHACGGECTHYGAPLAEGHLKEHIITCPWHNARFDVTTGLMDAPPALGNLSAFEVRVQDGEVQVRKTGSNVIPMPGGKDDRTFVILGAGAAGNAAAESLRRAGFAGRVVMVTRESDRPYDRTMLSKAFLAGDAPAKWLPLHGEKFYDRLQIEIMRGKTVVSLDAGNRTISFQDGGSLRADRLLLAPGGIPRTLNVPGTDLEGCFLLRSVPDSQAIIDACEKAGSAVILGAGFIGMEAAASLRKQGLEVHVVAPEKLPLALAFGEEVGRFIQELHRGNGVSLHLGHTARRIEGQGRVEGVELDDGTRLSADLVVIGVGIRPAVAFLEGSGLVKDGAVPVNGSLQTGAEGVYAAGDIAVVPDARTGEPRRVEHWVEAERQGHHAARAMLGDPAVYREIPFFWTRQVGNSLKYTGYAPQWDRVVFRGKPSEGSFLAGYYVGKDLKAVAGIGRAREFIVLGDLLAAGSGIAPEKLHDGSYDLLA